MPGAAPAGVRSTAGASDVGPNAPGIGSDGPPGARGSVWSGQGQSIRMGGRAAAVVAFGRSVAHAAAATTATCTNTASVAPGTGRRCVPRAPDAISVSNMGNP